jgi:hypothetical protein
MAGTGTPAADWCVSCLAVFPWKVAWASVFIIVGRLAGVY